MYKKYKRKDGKPADPKKKRQGRLSKQRGAAFERRIVALYRKYGWHVQHNTKGIYDLVCNPPTAPPIGDEPYHLADRITHFLQPTIQKYPAKDKKLNLIKNHGKWKGRDFLVQRQNKHPFKLIFTPIQCLKIRPRRQK